MAYLLKTNLRIEYGAFQKELLADAELTTGTLDTRFVGATLDPLSKVASYDPQGSAIGAAYVAAWNSYARDRLNYRPDIAFKSGIPIYSKWDYKHQPPGADKPLIMLPNVLPDLATAMKQNPTMKVMVNGGYFDVSTPYFEGVMELRHLPVPADAAEQHRISLLPVRPHGLRPPADAGRAARQRRGLHSADERGAVGSDRHARRANGWSSHSLQTNSRVPAVCANCYSTEPRRIEFVRLLRLEADTDQLVASAGASR